MPINGVSTAVEKLRCVERELKFRYRVYPKAVRSGKMTEAQMGREIRVMEDIAADYVAQLTSEERQNAQPRPNDLFNR